MRLLFLQPVLAHYRWPLLDRLARAPGVELHIHASEAVPGLDVSGRPPEGGWPWPVTLHRAAALAGGRLFWQHDLKLPVGWGPGDVLFAPGMPRYLSTWKLIVEARRRGLGIVWAGHGHTAGARSWNESLRRRLMPVADVILLYTDAEVADYQRRGFPAPILHALNNALDQEPMERARAEWTGERLAEFQRREGLDQPGARLLFCGRLTSKTRLPLLLQALALLGREARLDVIGDGDQRPRLLEEARRLGVTGQLHLHGALYSEEQLAPWFLSAHALAYPGAIGLSLLHAFGYGLPVVTHDNPQNQMPEFAALVPGKNGLLFREGDPRSLAEQLHRLCSEPELHAACSAEALRTVREDYTMDGMAARVLAAVQAASRSSLDRAFAGGGQG